MAERSYVAGPETNIGPKKSLPMVPILAAVVLSAVIVSVLSWLLSGKLRPTTTVEPWFGGGLAALSLVASILFFLKPWRTRTLGQWGFAIFHMSLLSLAPVLVGLVLLYSLSGMDAVVLGLTAAGAWWIGFLATVFVFGRVAKATECHPDPSPDKA